MAGFLINLDSLDALKMYIENGVYATKLSEPSGFWRSHHEGTFADYVTMKPKDNVYFFIKRKIYGIGELVAVGGDCKYCNFPRASIPERILYSDIREQLLWDEGSHSVNQRWICLFKAAPHFFAGGVDMDDVLMSNPVAFKMLRAFWKVSFLKFDDEENQAFKDVVLKLNQCILEGTHSPESIFATSHSERHELIEDKLLTGDYGLDVAPILESCSNGLRIQHEMALEAGILSQIAGRDASTTAIFGSWDYVSHQVVASPFKPIDYMDKMDVFGYAYITGYDPTRSRHLVVEIKKDIAAKDDVEQLLKYVDWVKDEYCFGDYSMINAFLVASSFPEQVVQHRHNVAVRKYTVGRRPAKSLEWANLVFVRYEFDASEKHLNFEIVS